MISVVKKGTLLKYGDALLSSYSVANDFPISKEKW